MRTQTRPTRREATTMIPLYHDFRGETVVVFGGGSVGYRKARRFATEARVVVVSPEFDPRFTDLDSESIELIRAVPTAATVGSWIDRIDPALVVIATNNTEINDAIETAASERKLLRNNAAVAGERSAKSVVVPATVSDGPVTVSISTGANSPALAKSLRQQIENEIEGAGQLAELTSELRSELKRSELSPAERRDAIRAVVRSEAVWKALHTGDTKAKKEATRVITETVGDWV